MNIFRYVRTANQPPMTRDEQAKLIRHEVEQNGYKVINTGCSTLDARLLGLLQSNRPKIRQAVITFRG